MYQRANRHGATLLMLYNMWLGREKSFTCVGLLSSYCSWASSENTSISCPSVGHRLVIRLEFGSQLCSWASPFGRASPFGATGHPTDVCFAGGTWLLPKSDAGYTWSHIVLWELLWVFWEVSLFLPSPYSDVLGLHFILEDVVTVFRLTPAVRGIVSLPLLPPIFWDCLRFCLHTTRAFFQWVQWSSLPVHLRYSWVWERISLADLAASSGSSYIRRQSPSSWYRSKSTADTGAWSAPWTGLCWVSSASAYVFHRACERWKQLWNLSPCSGRSSSISG